MMLSRYHVEITENSLQPFFAASSIREVVRANVGQDSLPSLFGLDGHRHVCDCHVQDSLNYIDAEHALIAELAQQAGTAAKQRAALGRLLHTAQDFYAHTNYVALWVAEGGGADRVFGMVVDGLDPQILAHPSLIIAQWTTWRDPFYYVPGLGNLLRRFCLPENSHEAIHLDSPDRGPYFPLAMAIARQRTRLEYARAVARIRQIGGQSAVMRFHGLESYAQHASPAEA